jgi:hypothetical protein
MGLAIAHDGTDVTDRLDVASLLKSLPLEYRRTGGMPGQAMTAASGLSLLEPLADGRDALVHAPGPGGLAGGYPVAVVAGRIRTALPDGMSPREAAAINLSGQVQDGISAIGPDGTVHFEPSAMAVLTAELGYDCRSMPLAEAEGRAVELGERFEAYRTRVLGS